MRRVHWRWLAGALFLGAVAFWASRRPQAPQEPPKTVAPPAATTQATPAAIPAGPRRIDLPRPKAELKEEAGSAIGVARDGVIKEFDGIYAYNTRTIGVTLDHGRVEVSPNFELKDVGVPKLSYQLAEIRCGAEVIARGGTVDATANLERREIVFERDAVTERYELLHDGIEQFFTIRELPKARGAITVSGEFETNLPAPADGFKGSELALRYKDAPILTVSKAVAIDADGRKLPLEIAMANGRMEMTVPADWVGQAKLPIAIDPLIGTPTTIDSSITAYVTTLNGQFVRVCDLVYVDSQGFYFVIWSERVGSSTFDYNIYGQRFELTGVLTNGAVPIATTANGEYECAVAYSTYAWSGGLMLVTWRDDPNNNSSVTDQRIAGRLLTMDGTPYSPIFVVDDQTGQDYAPSVAFDGAQYLVTYSNVVSSTNHNIRGRYVSPTGIPGAPVIIDTDSDLGARASVAWDGNVYLVVWEKTSGTVMKIVCRVVKANGYLETPITTLSTSALDCRTPDLCAGEGRFLVVWQENITGTDRDIMGRICDDALLRLSAVLPIYTGTSDQLSPRVTYNWDNHAWYVVCTDNITGGTDVYGKHVGLTGIVGTTSERLTSATSADVRPAVAGAPGQNKVVFIQLTGASSPYMLKGQPVAMPPVLIGPPGFYFHSAHSPGSIRWIYGNTDASITGYELLDSSGFLVVRLPVNPDVTDVFDGAGMSPGATITRKFRGINGPLGTPMASATGYTMNTSSGVVALSGWKVSMSVPIPPHAFEPLSGFQGQRSDKANFKDPEAHLFYVGPGQRQTYQAFDEAVEPNMTYWYRYYLVGEAAPTPPPPFPPPPDDWFWNPLGSVTTPNAPPKNFAGVAASSTSIQWSWDTFVNQNGFVLKNEDGVQSPTSPLETGLMENTRYTRTVHTLWGANTSEASPPVSVYTLARTATISDFTLAVDPGGVKITVVPPANPSQGYTGIKVYNSTNGTSWQLAGQYTGTYSFVDGNVFPNTLYYYQLAYVNGDNMISPVSGSRTITTGPGRPAAPANVAATVLSSSTVRWTWNAVPGATSYQLYNIMVSPPQLVGTTSTTTLDQTALPENSAAYCIVRAVNGQGVSNDSSGQLVYTLVHNATAADWTATVVNNTRIDFNIVPPTSVGGQTYFELTRSTNGTTWTPVDTFGYQVSDTPLNASTAYQYRLRYRNVSGVFSGYAPTKILTTYGQGTPTITGGNKKTRKANTALAGTAPAGTTVKIYFNGVLDGTATNSSGNWTYTTPAKAQGSSTVTAQASVGTSLSNFSAPITVTIDLTAPAPPSNLRIVTYHNAVDLEWDPSPSSDVLGYRIFRKTGTGGTWSMILANPGYLNGTFKYRDVNVVDGTTYYYRMTAVDDSVND